MLTPRQATLYRHSIDIFRFAEPPAAAGKPQPKSWTKIASGVPAYLEYTESDFGLNAGMLLSEQDMIFTLDVLHTTADVDMRVGDVFKVVAGPRVGFWRVRGNEKPKTRRANKQSFRSAIMEAPPLGVS
jgi:hypothetical protein